MENIGRLLMSILEGMKTKFTIYGFEISMWEIYVFVFVGIIITELLGGFFSE